MLKVTSLLFVAFSILSGCVAKNPLPNVVVAAVYAPSLPTGYFVAASMSFPLTAILFCVMLYRGWKSGLLGLGFLAIANALMFAVAIIGISSEPNPQPYGSWAGLLSGFLFFFCVGSYLTFVMFSERTVLNRGRGWVLFAFAIAVNLCAVVGFTHLNNRAKSAEVSLRQAPSNYALEIVRCAHWDARGKAASRPSALR